MHLVLVYSFGGLSLPRNSVDRLTVCRDMTIDVYHGRKTTIITALFQTKRISHEGLKLKKYKIKLFLSILSIVSFFFQYILGGYFLADTTKLYFM